MVFSSRTVISPTLQPHPSLALQGKRLPFLCDSPLLLEVVVVRTQPVTFMALLQGSILMREILVGQINL
jgi:hypothetical protein